MLNFYKKLPILPSNGPYLMCVCYELMDILDVGRVFVLFIGLGLLIHTLQCMIYSSFLALPRLFLVLILSSFNKLLAVQKIWFVSLSR